MRYSQITLAKYRGSKNWTLIYVRPLSIKSIVRIIKDGEKTLNFEDMTIFFTGKEVVDVYLHENHPLFNFYVIDKKLESAPQYKLVEEHINKTLDKIIKNHSKK